MYLSIRPILTAMCAIGLAGVTLTSPASATNFHSNWNKVDCDKGKSIQRRLDKAWPGQTISVSGTCNESIVIEKDRTTLDCGSLGNASIIGTGGAVSTISITARNVTISSCDVTAGDSTRITISVLRGGSMILEGNRISGARNTVVAVQSSYARVIGNEITSERNGVFVSSGSSADVVDNEIHNVINGVLVTNGASADIVGNTMTGSGTGFSPFGAGVFVSRASTGNFSNDGTFGTAANTIQNFTRGIRCFDNSAVRFTRHGGTSR